VPASHPKIGRDQELTALPLCGLEGAAAFRTLWLMVWVFQLVNLLAEGLVRWQAAGQAVAFLGDAACVVFWMTRMSRGLAVIQRPRRLWAPGIVTGVAGLLVGMLGGMILVRPRVFAVAGPVAVLLAGVALLGICNSVRTVLGAFATQPHGPDKATQTLWDEARRLVRAARGMILVGLVAACAALAMSLSGHAGLAGLAWGLAILIGWFLGPIVQVAAMEKATRLVVQAVACPTGD